MTPRTTTRRQFIKEGLAAGAVVTAPALLPGGSVLPSERFRVAHVGVGGRGGSLLEQSLGTDDVDVLAVCDVDHNHLARARERAGASAAAELDYRAVLDRKDVDAVIVAAPDHWHALVTIDACSAGKDVYVEKPLSTTIAEGRAMVDAARRYGRMVQVGINHRSEEDIRQIAEIVRSGRLGKVREVKTWMWENPYKERSPPSDPPPHLDYDRWLGPAPAAPYHPDRVHFNFRWCRDYAGGYMTDWGVHMMNVVTFAMEVDHKGPSSVEAKGVFYGSGILAAVKGVQGPNLYDFPYAMEAKWEFEDPDFTLTWTQPGTKGDVLPDEKYGMTFYGEAGELRTKFGGRAFYAGGKEAELPAPARSADVPRSPGHFRNWLDSIRSRELPIADVEIGHRTTALCILGNIALFEGRALRWDWKREVFIEDRRANERLGREARAPYRPRVAAS